MSHLDEGTLHALLDGELGTSHVHRVNAHLSSCATCETRLEEVKHVRGEADRLLGSLSPADNATRTPPPAPPPLPEREPNARPVLLIPDPPDSLVRRQQRNRMLGWAAMLTIAVSATYLALSSGNRTTFSPLAAIEAEKEWSANQAGRPDSAVLGPQEAVTKPSPAAAAPVDTPATPEQLAASGNITPPSSTDQALNDAAVAEAAKELAKIREQRAQEEQRFQEERRARDAQRAREERDERLRLRGAGAPAGTPTPAVAQAQGQRQGQGQPAAPPAPIAPTPPPSLEQRAGIHLSIGLDEATQQLGGPVHVIEGMSRAMIGLVHGRLSQGMDTTRAVVRVVYLDVSNRMIFLDQQRLRAGQSPGAETALRRVFGDVVVQLHGEPNQTVLRNLANGIR